MSKPKFTIFAGVNGVGKTSIYSILKKGEDFGERVNIDEIVAENGSWKDSLVQIFAARKALKIINECLSLKASFNEETTLTNSTVLKQIKKAKAKGYTVTMYYVGVENLQTAIKRVNARVEKGGHGVDENLIKARFEKMPETLHNIMPLCDTAFFYDNTLKFRQIAYLKNNILMDFDYDLPVWFWEIIARNDVNLRK